MKPRAAPFRALAFDANLRAESRAGTGPGRAAVAKTQVLMLTVLTFLNQAALLPSARKVLGGIRSKRVPGGSIWDSQSGMLPLSEQWLVPGPTGYRPGKLHFVPNVAECAYVVRMAHEPEAS